MDCNRRNWGEKFPQPTSKASSPLRLRSVEKEDRHVILTLIILQVGWACRQCSNVFQQESLLKNHQKLVCHGNGDAFRLIQIHYECVSCTSRLGTQVIPLVAWLDNSQREMAMLFRMSTANTVQLRSIKVQRKFTSMKIAQTVKPGRGASRCRLCLAS